MPTRDVYSAVQVTLEEQTNLTLEPGQGVKLSFSGYEMVGPLESNLCMPPVTQHVYWQMNTVGGKIK